MKRLELETTFTALALVGVLQLVAGCHEESARAEEHGSYAATSPLRMDTEITQDYVAQIHAIQHIELRALERGYLQDVFVDEGQFVKKGQRMFQIMPTLAQAELQKAEAEAEFAAIEFKNTKLLADSNVVSPNELALAKAKLDKAKAEVALSRVHRSLTEIRAPFDGIMGRLRVRRGSLLEEGELLTELSDNSKMWVYFNVTEAEYLDYQSEAHGNEPPEVQLMMANGKLFAHAGVVETIEADFDNETGTIAFRATFPNPDALLRHGETGKVLMTTPVKGALIVPQKATFEVLDKRYVYLVGEDHKLHSQAITVAHELPHLYVVADGLTESDVVLLDGLRKVKDGEEVSVTVVDAKEAISKLDVHAE